MKKKEEVLKKIEEIKNIISEPQSKPRVEDSVFILGFYSGFLAALSWVISEKDFTEEINGGEKTA